ENVAFGERQSKEGATSLVADSAIEAVRRASTTGDVLERLPRYCTNDWPVHWETVTVRLRSWAVTLTEYEPKASPVNWNSKSVMPPVVTVTPVGTTCVSSTCVGTPLTFR